MFVRNYKHRIEGLSLMRCTLSTLSKQLVMSPTKFLAFVLRTRWIQIKLSCNKLGSIWIWKKCTFFSEKIGRERRNSECQTKTVEEGLKYLFPVCRRRPRPFQKISGQSFKPHLTWFGRRRSMHQEKAEKIGNLFQSEQFNFLPPPKPRLN